MRLSFSILFSSLHLALPLLPSAQASLPALLEASCTSCHNPEKKKGKLDLTPMVADPSSANSDTLLSLLDVLKSGEMPPEDEPQPTPKAREGAIEVLDTMLQASAASPGRGNLIDHQRLFTEPKVRRAATPARLWRLSPQIFKLYANGATGTAFLNTNGGREGDDDLHPAFASMTPLHAFRDHVDANIFEEATSELLFDVCWQVAGLQLNANKRKQARAKTFSALLSTKPPTRQHWENAIQTQFELAVRREATEKELSELIALGEKTLSETNQKTAVQTVLATIMLRPDAVYRFEIGRGTPDQFGRVRLADEELANAIAFALTDSRPGNTMLAAVQSGELATKKGLLKQINRLQNDPTSEERIIRFFQEYFEYPRAVEVFKDNSHPNYSQPELRIKDADRLIAYILEEDKDVLKRLLTEDKLFAASDGGTGTPFFKKMMQKYYFPDFGIPIDWDWKNSLQPVKPTTGRRSGILTHPAWLFTFSDNEKNQAIQRGRWIYMKLLGGSIPDTPIGVDAVLPEPDGKSTLRDRMHVTRGKYCWRCHQRMGPLGLPLEQFNDFARWRVEELGKPVDTTGKIDIGDPALDGPVKDAFEMLDRMANSERVEQVFTRYVFRYFLGRNETLDDAPTLIDAHKAYRDSGGSFKALVASLLTSDSFLLRTR